MSPIISYFGTLDISMFDFPAVMFLFLGCKGGCDFAVKDRDADYKVMQRLRKIFNQKADYLKGGAMLMKWFKDVEALGREHFNTVVRTFKNNYKTIVNYFRSRATNASAESFNAKIKMFRTQLRGVSDPLFFIFRLCKLFA